MINHNITNGKINSNGKSIILDFFNYASKDKEFECPCGISCKSSLPFNIANVLLDGSFYGRLALKIPVASFKKYREEPYWQESIYSFKYVKSLKDVNDLYIPPISSEIDDVVKSYIEIAYEVENGIIAGYQNTRNIELKDIDHKNRAVSEVTKNGFIFSKDKLKLPDDYLNCYYGHTARILLIYDRLFNSKIKPTIQYFLSHLNDDYPNHETITPLNGLYYIDAEARKLFPLILDKHVSKSILKYSSGFVGITAKLIDEYILHGENKLANNLILYINKKIKVSPKRSINRKFQDSLIFYNLFIEEKKSSILC